VWSEGWRQIQTCWHCLHSNAARGLCNCRASISQSVCPSVHPSVCLSVQSSRCTQMRRVCCCGPGGQEIPISCCTDGGPEVSSSSATAAACHVVGWHRKLNTDLLLLFCRNILANYDFVVAAVLHLLCMSWKVVITVYLQSPFLWLQHLCANYQSFTCLLSFLNASGKMW